MDTLQLWKLYGCGWEKFWIWTTCWFCGWSCGVINCIWFAWSKPLFEGPAKSLGRRLDSSLEVWLCPLTKWLKMLDMFSFCWKDARALYDSIDWSDLCPVTAFMCLASTLWSDKTVTAVALTQRFVRWGSIPVFWLIFFIILLSMDWPIGALQNHTSSLRGSNVAEMALGRWKRQLNSGFKCLR